MLVACRCHRRLSETTTQRELGDRTGNRLHRHMYTHAPRAFRNVVCWKSSQSRGGFRLPRTCNRKCKRSDGSQTQRNERGIRIVTAEPDRPTVAAFGSDSSARLGSARLRSTFARYVRSRGGGCGEVLDTKNFVPCATILSRFSYVSFITLTTWWLHDTPTDALRATV